ncbi:hypothetical protein NL676_002925 [Syzygium grande]|nr:hypothetical protein NL676_002925 [Syzygium grande]
MHFSGSKLHDRLHSCNTCLPRSRIGECAYGARMIVVCLGADFPLASSTTRGVGGTVVHSNFLPRLSRTTATPWDHGEDRLS